MAAEITRLTKEQALQALQESEQRYRELVQNANSAIVRWKSDGSITFLNEYALTFFGYREEEIIGRPISILVPDVESDGRDLSSLVQDVATHPELYVRNINENIRRDGTRAWMAWTNKPIFDEEGEIREILAVGTDITDRKQGEDMIRKSEEKYRQLFQNMNEGFALGETILNENGQPCDFRLLEINDAFELQSGLGSDILGRRMTEVLPNLEKDWIEIYGKVALSGESVQFENYNKDLNRHFHVHCYCPVKGRFAILFWDITDSKQAEERLRQLSYFPHQNPNPVLRSTSGGRLLYANGPARRWLATMGWRAGGLLPQPVREAAIQALDLDQPIQSEITAPSGRTISITAVQPPGEGYINIYCTDITGRKQAEAELRKSENRFKILSDISGRLLISENPQGLVHELCQKVMEHLDCHVFINFLLDEKEGRLRLNAYAGIPEEEALKIQWLDLGAALSGCVVREGCRIVAEDISNSTDDRTDLVKSYGVKAYACHPLLIRDKTIGTLAFGSRTSAQFSSEDLDMMKTVTDQVSIAMERIRLIQELRQSKNELEQRVQERTAELALSNRELQDFAFVASHDLREPLRKVITFGDRLKMKYGEVLGEEGADYLRRMLNATIRMHALLDSLLEYSRITTQAEPFQKIDLGQVVREVLSDLEVNIEKTGGRVEVEELPFIFADAVQMRQLFQNLIGNALKFHRPDKKPTIKVGVSDISDNHLSITVEDNGIGFDEIYLDKIFAPFQRLNEWNKFAGTGMGLAICKKIVERHGGSITARSNPDQGSTFILTLPVSEAGVQ